MKSRYVLLLACVLSAPVFAATAVPPALKTKFEAADVDHDGKLTLAEAQAGMPRIAAHFDRIDAAHKGYITLDQVAAAAARN